MCFSPQRRAIFGHLNFKKWSETLSFLAFWLQNVLLATAACNFWFLLSAHDSAPAALTSLLFDSPDTRIIGKTQRFATPLTFGADVSSFFWLSRNCICFLLTLLHLLTLLSSDFTSSHLLFICFSTLHIVGSLLFKLPSIRTNLAKNAWISETPFERFAVIASHSAALSTHSFSCQIDMASSCSVENWSSYLSKNSRVNVDIGNCAIWRLRKAVSKFLAAIFFKASTCSVKNESTRWKHLWSLGRRATDPRPDTSQRTSSQSCNRSFSSTVKKTKWRTKKFRACIQSACLFAWLLRIEDLKLSFCSSTISAANLAKNSWIPATAFTRLPSRASRSDALSAHSFSCHVDIASSCSVESCSSYLSKNSLLNVDIGNCAMWRLRKAISKFLAAIFFKASACSLKNESTRWKHLWSPGIRATDSKVEMSQRINCQSCNNSFSSNVREADCRAKTFCARFHSACFLAWWLMTTSLKFCFCSCIISGANLTKKSCRDANAFVRHWADAPLLDTSDAMAQTEGRRATLQRQQQIDKSKNTRIYVSCWPATYVAYVRFQSLYVVLNVWLSLYVRSAGCVFVRSCNVQNEKPIRVVNIESLFVLP